MHPNEVLSQIHENTLNQDVPKKTKPKANLFPIAFTLLERGAKFNIRTAVAVKISNTEAVYLTTGKIVKIEASKVVKVKR